MFSVITNIYDKKTKGPTLMEIFTATGKLKKLFCQLETFAVCTTGDTALTDTDHCSSSPMLTPVLQELEYRIDVCRVTRGAYIEHL
jgi:hypothetical protein